MRFLLSICLLIICIRCEAQCLPDTVIADWDMAGFEGVIPEFTNIINITSFGAIANDTIDDHAAVVNAINFLNGNSGVIYFPPGNYLMHAMISLPDSTVLRGGGSDLTQLIFNFNNATSYSINISFRSFIAILPLQNSSVACIHFQVYVASNTS